MCVCAFGQQEEGDGEVSLGDSVGFYSFTLRHRHVLNWTRVSQASLREISEACRPQQEVLGWTDRREPGCRPSGVCGWETRGRDRHLTIRTIREVPGRKDRMRRERSDEASQGPRGHFLRPLEGSGQGLAEEGAGAGSRHQSAWPGRRGPGGRWEGAAATHPDYPWPRDLPSLLAQCLPPDTSRLNCPAEPTVWPRAWCSGAGMGPGK